MKTSKKFLFVTTILLCCFNFVFGIVNPSKSDSVKKCTLYINTQNYVLPTIKISYKSNGEYIFQEIKLIEGKGKIEIETLEIQKCNIFNFDESHKIKLEDKSYISADVATFYLEPGSTIKVSFDNLIWPKIEIKGGPVNNDFSITQNKIDGIRQEKRNSLKQIYSLSPIDSLLKSKLKTQNSNLDDQIDQIIVDFIDKNPKSIASLFKLRENLQSFDLNKLEKLSQKLKPFWRNNPIFSEIEEQISISKSVVEGATAPSFTKKDKDGKEITLSSFNGKYVLIDFWGTWCSPCRAGHPHLVKLYNTYSPKGLVFINVASERNLAERDKWLNAIVTDGLVWTQILNNEDKEKCDLTKIYNVYSFPTKILINPEGKIISRTIGNSVLLDKKLEEIFGK